MFVFEHSGIQKNMSMYIRNSKYKHLKPILYDFYYIPLEEQILFFFI